MAQERTDEELLAAYQQGDPGAFEVLLRRHRAPLFTFLLRMLGDRARAEDLAQETFLRIVKGAQAWEHRARFQTWLFTIARNLCVDQSRRDRFRRADSLDAEGPDGEPAMVDAGPGREIDPGRGAGSIRVRPGLTKAPLSPPPEQRGGLVARGEARGAVRGGAARRRRPWTRRAGWPRRCASSRSPLPDSTSGSSPPRECRRSSSTATSAA